MSAGQCGGEEPVGAGREAGGRILFSPGDSQRQQSLPLTRASRTLEVREGGGKQPASGGGSSDTESEDAAAGFQPRRRTKSLRGLVLLSHRLPGVEGAGEWQVGLLRPGRPAWPGAAYPEGITGSWTTEALVVWLRQPFQQHVSE